MIIHHILLFIIVLLFLNNINIQYEFTLLAIQNFQITNSSSKQNIRIMP